MGYRVEVQVREVRGKCTMGYRPGDAFVVEKFYIKDAEKGVCIHALAAMLTLLSPFLKGVPAAALGVGKERNINYAWCPEPRNARNVQGEG